MTEKAPKEIAEKVGVSASAVYKVQKRGQIRPQELVKSIAGRAIALAKQGKTRQPRRRKVCYFSENEKQRILAEEKNKAIIESIAGAWWKSLEVKKEFGSFENFLNNLKGLVSRELDYFNPDAVGKTGKPANVSAWISGGTKLFCKRAYFDAKKAREKEKTIRAGGQRVVARGWFYPPAKLFFRKLGMDTNKIAELGVYDVSQQTIKISEEKETGLTEKEKKVVRLRLEGKQLREIAKTMGFRAHSSVLCLESGAIAKIKKRLASLTTQ